MYEPHIKDVGFTSDDFFSALPTAGRQSGQSFSPLTLAPSSMYNLMGNLDGLVMNVDPNASLNVSLIADIAYFDPDNGARAVCSAVCYDAGDPANSKQVITSEYILNILQYADILTDKRHTISIGQTVRVKLDMQFDEFLSCNLVSFSCKDVDTSGNFESFGDEFAEKFSFMHGVEINYNSICAANYLCDLETSAAMTAFRVAKNQIGAVKIKGVLLDAYSVESRGEIASKFQSVDVDISNTHKVDVYYEFGEDLATVLCLITEKASGVTYAKSTTNPMIRLYVTAESAKLAECSKWPTSKVVVTPLSDDNGFQGYHNPVKLEYKTISQVDDMGLYSEDFVGFEDRLSGL